MLSIEIYQTSRGKLGGDKIAKSEVAVIVDGQNVRPILGYLISRCSVKFLSLLELILESDTLIVSRMVSIIYRDYINGDPDQPEVVYGYQLFDDLRSQGVVVLDDNHGADLRRKRNYNLDPLIKDDIRKATEDTNIRTIILFSGDGGFGKVLSEARYNGKMVIVVSGNNYLSPKLFAAADQVVSIEKLAAALGCKLPYVKN